MLWRMGDTISEALTDGTSAAFATSLGVPLSMLALPRWCRNRRMTDDRWRAHHRTLATLSHWSSWHVPRIQLAKSSGVGSGRASTVVRVATETIFQLCVNLTAIRKLHTWLKTVEVVLQTILHVLALHLSLRSKPWSELPPFSKQLTSQKDFVL